MSTCYIFFPFYQQPIKKPKKWDSFVCQHIPVPCTYSHYKVKKDFSYSYVFVEADRSLGISTVGMVVLEMLLQLLSSSGILLKMSQRPREWRSQDHQSGLVGSVIWKKLTQWSKVRPWVPLTFFSIIVSRELFAKFSVKKIANKLAISSSLIITENKIVKYFRY